MVLSFLHPRSHASTLVGAVAVTATGECGVIEQASRGGRSVRVRVGNRVVRSSLWQLRSIWRPNR